MGGREKGGVEKFGAQTKVLNCSVSLCSFFLHLLSRAFGLEWHFRAQFRHSTANGDKSCRNFGNARRQAGRERFILLALICASGALSHGTGVRVGGYPHQLALAKMDLMSSAFR